MALAPATFPPFAAFGIAPLSAGSTVEAEAIVRPFKSSTTCTYIWATLRNTVSRGRASFPCTRLRMRCLIRARRSSLVLILIVACLLGSGLPDLLLQHFAGVAHALLLVRIRLAQPAHVGGHLPDELTIGA